MNDKALISDWARQDEASPSFRISLAAIAARYGLVLFLVVCVLPSVVTVAFYGLIASDRYVSEAHFIVRGVNKQQISGLSTLLRTFGVARSNDDSYAIHDYLRSRDVIGELEREVPLRELFSDRRADVFSRYDTVLTGDTFEDFYEYFRRRVRIIENLETGITSLRVTAFRAEDAKLIAEALLSASERRVNQMNERARVDTLSFAEQLLSEAGEEVVRTQLDLTRFRNAELLISPEEVAAGGVSVIVALTQQMVTEEARLRGMRVSSPANPSLPALEQRVASLRAQIDAEQAKLTGPDDSLATALGRYEELLLRRTLADQKYETAVKGLDDARIEAARKQIYIEPLVMPSMPDKSTEPKRIRTIFTVMLISFASFVMLYLLVAGGREHMNLDN